MGLNELINNRFRNHPVSEEEGRVADEVFPDLWQGRKAPRYRLMVLSEFLDRRGEPMKRDENGTYRTPDESRYDRAVGRVGEVVDRDGKGTVVGCSLRMYEERDGATERFINDLRKVEEKLKQES